MTNNINPVEGLRNRNAGSPVNQYSLEGEFIKKYKTITEASKETESSYIGIIKNCNGKAKSAGSFQWRYDNK